MVQANIFAASPKATSPLISEQQWADYQRDGYIRLGPLLTPAEVEALCARADDLALGKSQNPAVEMQLDTGGKYEELPGAVKHFSEATLRYRKIQGLESDDLFRPLLAHPLLAEISAAHYGRHAPVSLFRAMIMNKPAGHGTYLPWHQDGGDVWKLDRDPLVTLWVALDPATKANGCVEVVPGTHRLGLLTTYGSTISDEDAARYCPPESIVPMEVESGHGLLMHNWLIHRSGVNPSDIPRRAFTACYMDGRTLNTLTSNRFPLIFGEEAPHLNLPYLEYMRTENGTLKTWAASAEEYARSLEQDNKALRENQNEVERYVQALRAELARAEQAQAATAELPPAPVEPGGWRGWLRRRLG